MIANDTSSRPLRAAGARPSDHHRLTYRCSSWCKPAHLQAAEYHAEVQRLRRVLAASSTNKRTGDSPCKGTIRHCPPRRPGHLGISAPKEVASGNPNQRWSGRSSTRATKHVVARYPDIRPGRRGDETERDRGEVPVPCEAIGAMLSRTRTGDHNNDDEQLGRRKRGEIDDAPGARGGWTTSPRTIADGRYRDHSKDRLHNTQFHSSGTTSSETTCRFGINGSESPHDFRSSHGSGPFGGGNQHEPPLGYYATRKQRGFPQEALSSSRDLQGTATFTWRSLDKQRMIRGVPRTSRRCTTAHQEPRNIRSPGASGLPGAVCAFEAMVFIDYGHQAVVLWRMAYESLELYRILSYLSE